jgi:hypothetical protein
MEKYGRGLRLKYYISSCPQEMGSVEYGDRLLYKN